MHEIFIVINDSDQSSTGSTDHEFRNSGGDSVDHSYHHTFNNAGHSTRSDEYGI